MLQLASDSDYKHVLVHVGVFLEIKHLRMNFTTNQMRYLVSPSS
jgi:hypothetical protein